MNKYDWILETCFFKLICRFCFEDNKVVRLAIDILGYELWWKDVLMIGIASLLLNV